MHTRWPSLKLHFGCWGTLGSTTCYSKSYGLNCVCMKAQPCWKKRLAFEIHRIVIYWIQTTCSSSSFPWWGADPDPQVWETSAGCLDLTGMQLHSDHSVSTCHLFIGRGGGCLSWRVCNYINHIKSFSLPPFLPPSPHSLSLSLCQIGQTGTTCKTFLGCCCSIPGFTHVQK